MLKKVKNVPVKDFNCAFIYSVAFVKFKFPILTPHPTNVYSHVVLPLG